jgi:aryl-alcohol dehydrogenase-like predicted oxidoreductase
MKYRLLGRSGLRVSEVCLGALTFGELPFLGRPFGISAQDSEAIFRIYADRGGNFIDTADIYGAGLSESYVGNLVASDRDHFVVATKYGITMKPGDPNFSGSHRKNMVRAVEESLRRLRTDRIDLYWLHFWDSLTPVEELMRGLDDLVRAGKVLYVGVSDAPAWRVSQANMLAELRGWTPFVGLQVEYSLIERSPERDLLPMAAACGMSVTAWSPLGGSVLTGKYCQEVGKVDSHRTESNKAFGKLTERNLSIAQGLKAVAAKLGRSPAQVALAWLRQRTPPVIAILGARTVGQLEDNLGSLTLELPVEAAAELDRLSAIALGFPHEFLANNADWFYGGTKAQMDS